MNIFVRLFLAIVGVLAIGVAVYRFRSAVSSADEAARFDAIPKRLHSVTVYRVSAAITGAMGGAFILLAISVH